MRYGCNFNFYRNSILCRYFKYGLGVDLSFALFQMWRVEVEAMERLDRLEGNLLKMNGD